MPKKIFPFRVLALPDRICYESKLNSLYRKFSSADLHSQSPRLAPLRSLSKAISLALAMIKHKNYHRYFSSFYANPLEPMVIVRNRKRTVFSFLNVLLH